MSKYPPLETREKIKKWCDLQERSQSEVAQKLRLWGLNGDESDQILVELITENYLNEERFARAFARGKFRIKRWGWSKIETSLKQKRISSFCIALAKEEIDEDEYRKTLINILEKKWPLTRGESVWQRKQKLYRYALSKGYRSNEIQDILNTELADFFA